jgi:hypothetical protein
MPVESPSHSIPYPEADRPVTAPRDQHPPIRGKCQAFEPIGPTVAVHFFAGCHTPQSDRSVVAGGGQGFAIGREGQGYDVVPVTLQQAQFPTGIDFSELHD